MANNSTRELVVWQWNSASFKKCKAPLLQFVASQADKPQVIILQETLGSEAILTGYRVASSKFEQGKRAVATLVANKCSFQERDLNLGNAKAEAAAIEIILNGWLKNSVFVVNVYSPPYDHRQLFASIITNTTSMAKGAPLIVAKDFNAPHEDWGYARPMPKGERLLEAVTKCSLALVTDPRYPTRSKSV